MDLTGFIRDDCRAEINRHFEITRFNCWQGTIGYSNPKKNPAPRDQHITMIEQTQYLQIASLLTTAFHFQYRGPRCISWYTLLCVNTRSNKIPLTPPSPSGRLKRGPCGHHINFLCAPSERRVWLLLLQVLATCPRFWSFPQLVYFVTWTSHLLQPPPPLKTPLATLHTSPHPTPTWVQPAKSPWRNKTAPSLPRPVLQQGNITSPRWCPRIRPASPRLWKAKTSDSKHIYVFLGPAARSAQRKPRVEEKHPQPKELTVVVFILFLVTLP